MRKLNRGFTLIELLIVIALIGILAVALLSAINPVEQARKARDSGRKSDAAELLNAYERYYTTFGCYPWAGGMGTVCGVDSKAGAVAFNPTFGAGEESEKLITSSELKEQFKTRDSITNATPAKRLYVSETATAVISVCFEPESTNARNGGLGSLKNDLNTVAGVCGASYGAGGCFVCVPQ